MLTTATTELIHSVLDGEASDAQAQQLQHLLAADPAAHAEFDAVQRLFADLKSVPQRHPPEGLVAAVMAEVKVPAAKSRRSNQLFSWPRVFGTASRDTVSTTSPNPHRNTRLQSFFRSIDMSQQTRSPFASRKIWIGGAIAAAAVVVVAQFGLDGKTNDKDVIGTIAPAERYRAPQPTAGDIKVGTTTTGQSGQPEATAPAESAQKAAAEKSAEMAAGKAAEKSAEMAAGKAAEKSAQMAAGKAAEKSAEMAAGKAAEKSAEMAAGRAAEKSAEMAAGKAAEKAAEKSAQAAAAKAAEKAAEMAAGKAAERAAAAAAK